MCAACCECVLTLCVSGTQFSCWDTTVTHTSQDLMCDQNKPETGKTNERNRADFTDSTKTLGLDGNLVPSEVLLCRQVFVKVSCPVTSVRLTVKLSETGWKLSV